MKVYLTIKQFMVMRDLVEMAYHIPQQRTIKYHTKIDGWHGKGSMDYNRHEHNGKVQFVLPDEEGEV